MRCKEAEALIPAYLSDELEADDLKGFLEHIDKCGECREELAIQFLITEGLNSLSTGDSYDLKHAMEERVSRSKGQIKLHDRLFAMRNFSVALVGGALLISVFLVYFYLF